MCCCIFRFSVTTLHQRSLSSQQDELSRPCSPQITTGSRHDIVPVYKSVLKMCVCVCMCMCVCVCVCVCVLLLLWPLSFSLDASDVWRCRHKSFSYKRTLWFPFVKLSNGPSVCQRLRFVKSLFNLLSPFFDCASCFSGETETSEAGRTKEYAAALIITITSSTIVGFTRLSTSHGFISQPPSWSQFFL